jgi:hypothetical protein
MGSREFTNTLTKMLVSQEGTNTVTSLQGDDALALVNVLDQVSKPPEVQEIVDMLYFVHQFGNKYLR